MTSWRSVPDAFTSRETAAWRDTSNNREGTIEGFTSEYGLKRLVFVEAHQDIAAAIRREKTMKTRRCAWKARLIEAGNPGWEDLYDRLALGA